MDESRLKEEVACGTCGWRGTYKTSQFDQATKTYHCPQCLSAYLVQVSELPGGKT